MSSILKALRKLEEEKTALGEERVDIARDILKRSAQRPEPRNIWPLVSLGLLVLLLAGAGYFLLRQPGLPPAVVETVQLPTAVEKPAASAAAQPAPIKVAERPSASTEPVQSEPVASGSSVPVESAVAEPVVAVAPALVSKPVVKAIADDAPLILRPDGSPFIKLSGIAYRENPLERIAIVNDLPVMQGTKIEGVEVVEISRQTVLFRWKGQSYHLAVEAE